MKHKKLFALFAILLGVIAVLLSLVSIEEAQYTAPPPAPTPFVPQGEPELTSRRDHAMSVSPLPAGDTDEPEPTPTPSPPPMDRAAYEDGDLWIQIPGIGINAPVIGGTAVAQLKKGPGLYEKSPMPDEEDGNVCIAGHRTTYGAWFRHIDDLSEGDAIILFCEERQFAYEVEEIFVVDRYDWSVTEPVGYTALTLTACHPPGSARQRIVVQARRAWR